MASGEPPNPPAASGSNENAMSDSPPKYVPQFSATTEMILKRINSGASASGSLSSIGITGTPPGYEDMRRSVLMSMKTTMNMEMPTTPVSNRGGRRGSANKTTSRRTSTTPSGSGAGSASGGKGKGAARGRGRAGTKRKRVKEENTTSEEESDGNMSKLGEDSDSDESEEVTELPKITQSGRQIHKPAQFIPTAYEPSKRRAPSKRSQEQALCKRCGRGHSPQNNMIVFCDGCNLGWHQMCHDPVISEEEVKDEDSDWYCADCALKRGIKVKSKTPESAKGVSWQGKSQDEKRAYLSSLSQQHLVSLLLQATALHPNLPIFPPTTTAIQYSRPHSAAPSSFRTSAYQTQPLPFPPSATSTAGLFSRAEANPNAPINFIRKIAPGQTPPASSSFQSQPTFTHASSAPPTLAVQAGDSRDSTPVSPPYPKAGNGLMAKLGPDEDDLAWLVDNSDFDAFSHVVFDEHGQKAEENGIPVNGA